METTASSQLLTGICEDADATTAAANAVSKRNLQQYNSILLNEHFFSFRIITTE